jgi:malate dehydrogenase (oxaloacetate-decarboxylating)
MSRTRLSRHFDIEQTPNGEPVMRVFVDGISALRSPILNKGTAFTDEERVALCIDGLLPPHENTLEDQSARAYENFKKEPNNLAKYTFLRDLQDRNETLFFALLSQHIEEMMPIVYTPTVGDAIKAFSHIYRSARGIALSRQNVHRAKEIFAGYHLDDVRMIVATDSSAILGIGDQGYGGIGISIGKLALYTAGGLAPYHTLPVGLDVGTDRAELRNDPLYLGVREPRLHGEAYFAVIDAFVEAVKLRYPRAILQWEDLSKDTAFDVLERHRDTLPSFNDDIQGTGSVALAGLISSCRIKGEKLRDQVFVLSGAGAGGIGVTWAIVKGLQREGLSEAEAHARVMVLDSKGLLTADRDMEAYKRPYAQPRERIAGWKIGGPIPNLHETLRESKATVLIGLSGQGGQFDEAAIKQLLSFSARPIVMPLSNPTSACEVLPSVVMRITDGKALVATGSPFADCVLRDGSTVSIGQGNNAFIFPGLGMGAVLCEARRITDAMVLESAYALASYTEREHGKDGRIYPRVTELRKVACEVAAHVIRCAHREGVARSEVTKSMTEEQLEAFVARASYEPKYLRTLPGSRPSLPPP